MVLATDARLDARQLRRLAMRAGAGLARTGSHFGHGSGDVALAFTNAYRIPNDASEPMPALAMLHDGRLDALFEAAAEATEQAIVNALFAAATVRGFRGHERRGFSEVLPGWDRG
jgi:D-aminopeptidase